MEPKTMTQRLVSGLSKKLRPISDSKIRWGLEHNFSKCYHKYRGHLFCLECGHKWKPELEVKQVVCPSCQAKLKAVKDYKSYMQYREYFAVLQVVEGFQVVRMVCVDKMLKMNKKTHAYGKEVMQHWIDQKGKAVTLSIGAQGMSASCDQWAWGTTMEVRGSTSYKAQYRHNISPAVTYPRPEILPIFKRNGFKGDFGHHSPTMFITELLRNSQMETLLKAKQHGFIDLLFSSGISHKMWPSIKICIRNKYFPKDSKIYADYIDLLIYFNKDIRNAKFVCPKNLKAAHDVLMNKKRKIDDALRRTRDIERKKEQAIKAKENEEKFLKEKAPFFNIRFSDGVIEVVVLDSINEIMKEGDTLKHCVFTNQYYAKEDSLIMSARVGGERTETIELSLSKLQVVQCRGRHNISTEYHDQILNLVKSNIPKIAKVSRAVKRTAKTT